MTTRRIGHLGGAWATVAPTSARSRPRSESRPVRTWHLTFRQLATLGVLFALALGAAHGEYVIKFSHVVDGSAPKGQAAQYFADEVNRRLAGRVRVDLYPNAKLFDDDGVLEAMRLAAGNTGLMAAPSLSKFTRYSSQLQLFDLPFLFKDLGDVQALADSPLAEKLVAPLERRGMRGLALWDSGMKVFTVRGPRPLRKVPDDFRGKRFRIQPSAIHEAMIERLGGTPITIPVFAKVRAALADGVVDGQETTWANVRSQRFFEVQDWISVSNHGYLGSLVVVSIEFWQQLPADLRKELEGILREATLRGRELARHADMQERETLERLKPAAIVDLTEDERAAWRAATAVIEHRFAAEIGDDLLREVHGFLDNRRKAGP